MPEITQIIACGSVDDGKSTLLGKLLFDLHTLKSEDLIRAGFQSESTTEIDYSLILDGLIAERDKRITIDVAYRSADVDGRRFRFADCPGHAHFTRNMITACSMSSGAIILVDARHGLREQTIRHTRLCALFGIKNLIFAVNKMDQISDTKRHFDAIHADILSLMSKLDNISFQIIPTIATRGANVFSPEPSWSPWYSGPTILDALRNIDPRSTEPSGFRLFAQQVNVGEETHILGTLASGSLTEGVWITNGRKRAQIKRLLTNGAPEPAKHGDAVAIIPTGNADFKKGDLLFGEDNPPKYSKTFRSIVVSTDAQQIKKDQRYIIKTGTRQLGGQIAPRHLFDVTHGKWLPFNKSAGANSITECTLKIEAETYFDTYVTRRMTGCFIVISPNTGATVGAGIIIDETADLS